MAHSVNTALSHGTGSARSISLRGRIATFLAVTRQRRHLAALDQHLLEDIGVTQAQVRDETRKSGWDVPQHWHQ